MRSAQLRIFFWGLCLWNADGYDGYDLIQYGSWIHCDYLEINQDHLKNHNHPRSINPYNSKSL